MRIYLSKKYGDTLILSGAIKPPLGRVQTFGESTGSICGFIEAIIRFENELTKQEGEINHD